MPNVMGREFPYTPEGMAAAQQYAQAMGMRGGGSMGFRPIGMQEGGDADMVKLANDLYALMQGGTDEQVSNFIRGNRTGLEMAAAIPDSQFNMVRSALKLDAQLQPMPQPMPYVPNSPLLRELTSLPIAVVDSKSGRQNDTTRGMDGVITANNIALSDALAGRSSSSELNRMADRVRELQEAPTDYYPPETRENNQPYYPEKRAGGGIMSLRGY